MQCSVTEYFEPLSACLTVDSATKATLYVSRQALFSDGLPVVLVSRYSSEEVMRYFVLCSLECL